MKVASYIFACPSFTHPWLSSLAMALAADQRILALSHDKVELMQAARQLDQQFINERRLSALNWITRLP